MEDKIQAKPEHSQALSDMMRDWLTVGLRHRRLVALSFLGVFLGAILAALLLPLHYQAQTKILVKHERRDPIVTPDPSSTSSQISPVTEVEVNSEVELMRGRELLEKVVLACGLQNSENQSGWRSIFGRSYAAGQPQEATSAAVRKLATRLRVETLPKTSLISITYESTSPQRAAQVLTTLVNLYFEKHLAVHRSSGAFEFFRQQTKQYEQGLADAESRLLGFSQQEGVVSPQQEKDSALRKVSEFDSALKQTQAAIAETARRIHTLEGQAASTPSRLTTQVRTADNPQLMGQLKSTLLNLELKRTELLGKFEPSYRLVQEVETQIAQTRAAIESAEKSQLREETTDRDPTYEWAREELAKARSELAALRAREEAMSRSVRSYQEDARKLDQKEMIQQSLLRDLKAEETNYLLYLRKQEEARISDALDRSRIVNVAVAEPATVPSRPTRARSLVVLLGFLLAVAVGIASAIVAEYLDPALRTPHEVEEFLDVPVLASVSSNGR